MNPQFNPNKPYQCRDGCKAKIADFDFNGEILYIRTSHRKTTLVSKQNGLVLQDSESPNDLINIPEKKMLDIWVNVYSNYANFCYQTKELCDSAASSGRTACLHIQREYVEGEGL